MAAAGLSPERQVFWFKLPFALCDLGAIAVLWRLLAAHGLPRARILIYAWSPLTRHGILGDRPQRFGGCAADCTGALAAAKKRWTWAFVALSLAAAAKIWPILLVSAVYRMEAKPAAALVAVVGGDSNYRLAGTALLDQRSRKICSS